MFSNCKGLHTYSNCIGLHMFAICIGLHMFFNCISTHVLFAQCSRRLNYRMRPLMHSALAGSIITRHHSCTVLSPTPLKDETSHVQWSVPLYDEISHAECSRQLHWSDSLVHYSYDLIRLMKKIFNRVSFFSDVLKICSFTEFQVSLKFIIAHSSPFSMWLSVLLFFFSPAKTTLSGQGYGFCWWRR